MEIVKICIYKNIHNHVAHSCVPIPRLWDMPIPSCNDNFRAVHLKKKKKTLGSLAVNMEHPFQSKDPVRS